MIAPLAGGGLMPLGRGMRAPSPYLTGLTHAWLLDAQSGQRNDSVGSAHLADNNTVGYAAGKNGNAASFIKANAEYLSVARPSDLAIGAAKTVSLWASWTSGQGCPFAIANATTTTDGNPQLFFGVSDAGQYKFWCASTYSSASVAATTGWHHWLFTDSGSAQNLYVDNVLVASRSGAVLNDKTTLYVGQGYWGYWNGPVDEVYIWNYVFSAADRAYIYNAGAGKFYPSF